MDGPLSKYHCFPKLGFYLCKIPTSTEQKRVFGEQTLLKNGFLGYAFKQKKTRSDGEEDWVRWEMVLTKYRGNVPWHLWSLPCSSSSKSKQKCASSKSSTRWTIKFPFLKLTHITIYLKVHINHNSANISEFKIHIASYYFICIMLSTTKRKNLPLLDWAVNIQKC